MQDNLLLTTGQMAKLHKTTKRLLQYYDEINLFSPAIKGENEYRYYSYEQSPELEIILSLSELGMKLNEIKDYLTSRSPENLYSLLKEKQRLLREKLKNLQLIDQMLSNHINNVEQSFQIPLNSIYTEYQQEEHLLATPETTEDSIETIYKTISGTLINTDERHLYCHICGSILPESSWQNQDYTTYNRYYFKTVAPSGGTSLLNKPAGNYLCINWLGNWNTLKNAYSILMKYAKNNCITLVGDAYEDTIVDSFAVQNDNEYVTKIMIRIA
ncbi:MerR family transcriptional regulator [Clostridium cellulovorans]|uniref:Transcriptional regulator, MerR family n=1 Tax=Clostridium cellulovorans (strain ATCC 35296 / DSM 3052 / OCM 3 / 743B) TaxID=573061 RepID=D9SWA1_CLOC7|nr:MerR family transcriptional regulator [Clostridium cellulovorans]ADL51245.1 transcriptional regulator, MerR family [Clostridium cellulovorans 743B]